MKRKRKANVLEPRPLYVDGGRGVRLVLEGGSLRLTRASCADVRVPLKRVSRVCLRGEVQLSSSLLAGCCEAGIAVVVQESSGKVRGAVSPSVGELPTALGDRLAMCADSAVARAACRLYFEGAERAAMRLALDELAASVDAEEKPSKVRRQLTARNAGFSNRQAERYARKITESICRAAAIDCLSTRGVDPGRVRRETGMDLIGALYLACQWSLEPLLAEAATVKLWEGPRRELVKHLERGNPEVKRAAARWIRGLEHRLGEALG